MKAIQFWIIVLSVILISAFSVNGVNATYNTEYETCIKLMKTGPETAVPGETITYHFMVKNCGELPLLSGYKVYDPLLGDGVIWKGDLQPGEYDEFDMDYTVTTEDCGNLVNTAWAVGYPKRPDGTFAPPVRDDDTLTTYVDCEPRPCSLEVTKSCFVPVPPPTGTFDCAKPIDSLTMIWDGVRNIKIIAWKGSVGSTLLKSMDNIVPDQAVTVTGYAGSPNDVYWEIFEAGTNNKIGESKFHLSCSDEEMNGEEDCGKLEGNGKDNDAGLINNWILAGMVDSRSSFNCFPEDPSSDPVSTCEITIPSQIECDNKLKTLVFEYMGGDCSQTSNWQEGKFKCSGDAGLSGPVQIVITKDADKITVVPDGETIMPGDEITLIADTELRADTMFDIVRNGVVLQSLNIHTSCSKPVRLGDRFGSMKVIAMDIKDGDYLSAGAEVEYTYVIENTGEVPVEHIRVVDDILGEIPGSPIELLQPGETTTLEATEFVKETTTNFVHVNGVKDLGAECNATASSTVNVLVPKAECVAAGASQLNLGKGDPMDKIEWEIANNGSANITIKSITVSWPPKFGKLKKIKRDGDTIFEPADVDRPGPGCITITSFKGDLNKRQIKANENDKLTFEFDQKAVPSPYDLNITVDFFEGCSVDYAR